MPQVTPSQVAILGPYTRRKGTLGLGKLGKFSLTEDLEAWRKNVAVLYSTARAFKGLEAQAVILIDIGELDPKFFGKVDLYVACSRAKHELVVCTCSDEVNKLLT